MLLYVAGKYAGENEAEKMANIGLAKHVAIILWNNGHAVICPHLNTMDFEYYTELENKDFVLGDLLMVERCDGIVMLPNYRESRGALMELEHARAHNVDVYIWPMRPLKFEETKGDD